MEPYQDEIFVREYKALKEYFIRLQGQLHYAFNNSDWCQAAIHAKHLSELFSQMETCFSEADERRRAQGPTTLAIGIAIIWDEAAFFPDSELQAMRQIIIDNKGQLILFVKKGIEFPRGFLDDLKWQAHRFKDEQNLHQKISTFLGSTHWKFSEAGRVEVFGHAARRLYETLNNTQQQGAGNDRKTNDYRH